MAIISGTTNGSAAAGTITPESSANHPITRTSQQSQESRRSKGKSVNAALRVRSRNAAGRHSATPAATAMSGTSQPRTLSVKDPTLALTFRSSRSPARPCNRFPANAPMSDTPAAGSR